MSRRLPIYFLIDVSESMVGEQIQLVEEGLASIIKDLKTDPYALETCHVSIIAFAGRSVILVPLTEIIQFYPPKFPIGGGTSLSDGISALMNDLKKNVVTTTIDRKGDWKPIIFLFTDGVPTDDPSSAIAEWKSKWKAQTNLVAVSFGEENDLNVLKQITDNVLLFKNITAHSYREFFKWVTASIKASSVSVDSNGNGFEMARMDAEVLTKIDISKPLPASPRVDPNFAVFIAKCQNTKRPYLIKYQRSTTPSEIGADLHLETLYYRLKGAYPVDNSYFELSGDDSLNRTISTDELYGFPNCPCCGNQYGFSVCMCGKLHCVGNEKISICPWCGNPGEYGNGSETLNIKRSQG